MRIKRMGIEWGSAYLEAQPVLITADNGDRFEIFEREGGGITIRLHNVDRVAVVQGDANFPLEIQINQ